MEHKIFFTADTHFGHDRGFVGGERGFTMVDEMNEALVRNWNRVVRPGDTVYHLGDVYLLDDKNADYVRRLAGNIHLIRGNHDTEHKMELLSACPNIKSISWGEPFVYQKWHFFLCHYPTLTCDTELNKENIGSGFRNRTMCLHGHTHQAQPFFNDEIPYIYNVGADAHECRPISIEEIMEDINRQHEELQRRIR